jgi:biotin carboxyl carrier protein
VIDLSKLQAPGWRRVVAELSSDAPDDRAFLARLLSVLGQVSGARQASLYAVSAGEQGEDTEPKCMLTWPVTPEAQAGKQEAGAIEDEADVLTAVRATSESGQVRVFGLESGDRFYEGSRGRGYVVAVPVSSVEIGVGLKPIIALVLDGRSEQALQATLSQLEVLAGYSSGHAARQLLKRTRESSAALDLAGKLIASINMADGCKGAVFQVVNDLARHLKCDRVALGWVRHGDTVRVTAISDTEQIDHRLKMVRQMQAAMEECLDQEQAVMYPAPPPRVDAAGETADPLLAAAITHAHRDIASADATLKVASLPLRVNDDVLGVVTIELAGDGVIDSKVIELIQATLDLVAPVLAVRRSDDRPLPVRTKDAVAKAGAWSVGPRHTVWKLAGIAVFFLFVFVSVVHVPYRIEAPMVLKAREQRQVSAPFDAMLVSVPERIKPGAEVQAGDVLFVMDTMELQRQASSSRVQLSQAMAEADAARMAGKDDEEAQALRRAEQTQADLDLYEYKINQATVTAPIRGTVVEGDLQPLIGSTLKLGQPILRVAQIDDLIAVARVEDSDIRLVQRAIDEAAADEKIALTSAIATKANPSEVFAIKIDREDIIPLSQPEEGVNAFEVRAEFVDAPAAWMQPGMEGIARIDTGKRSILGIGSRRIIDTVRLWIWR